MIGEGHELKSMAQTPIDQAMIYSFWEYVISYQYGLFMKI